MSSTNIKINKNYNIDIVLKKCRWLRNYKDNQAIASEKEWHSVLRLIKHTCNNGKTPEQLAHEFSIDHPLYDYEGTERVFQQIKERQPNPTPCSQFKALRPESCESCPYSKWVSTPLLVENVEIPASEMIVVKEEVVRDDGTIDYISIPVPTPPDPYFRGKNGGVYITLEGNTESKRIYEYDIFPVRRLRDEETGNESLEVRLNLPKDGQVSIKIPNHCLNDFKRFPAILSDKGAFVRPHEITALQTYLIDYAKKLQKEEAAQEEFTRFGWRDIDTENPRFILGDYVVSHMGELRRSTPAPHLYQLRHVISAKGDLDKWKESFNVYNEVRCDAYRFTQLLGFAAPLLALTPFCGLTYNMVGGSGQGKSTALRMMSSIWGKPNHKHIQVQDTPISIFNTIGALQNIPITFDEITTISSDTLADMVYRITEGRGRNRADERGFTRKNLVHWNTVVCGTSNISLYEKLGMAKKGNNAHAYRIFEVATTHAKDGDRPKIDYAMSTIENHYGMAGRIYIAYVIKNLVTIREMIEQMCVHYTTHYKMATSERFWYVLFACVAVGGSIAKKLELHDYDVDHSVEWAAAQLVSVRELVKSVEGDHLGILANFFKSNITSVVHIYDNQPQEYTKTLLNIRVEWMKNRPVRGYIAITVLRDFCMRHNVDYSWLCRKLKEDRILLENSISKNLGSFTSFLTGSVKCIEIDLTKISNKEEIINNILNNAIIPLT